MKLVNPLVGLGSMYIFFNEDKTLTKVSKITLGVLAVLVLAAVVTVGIVVL